MTALRVAGGQIAVTKDIEANTATIVRAIEFAGNAGAEILLTPEGSLNGYTSRFDREKVLSALDTVIDKAVSRGVGLALGTCCSEDDGKCYDQIGFYGANGVFWGFHSKILLSGAFTDPPEGEINEYEASPPGIIGFNGLKIGDLVCNDMWANPQCTPMADPHLSQRLSQRGAAVILHAVNGGHNAEDTIAGR